MTATATAWSHSGPHCGEEVDSVRWADQYQTELPDPRVVTIRFRVGCKHRIQRRHPEQTSDALPTEIRWAFDVHK